MSVRSWILCSDDPSAYVGHLEIARGQLSGPASELAVSKRRLESGLSQGVDVVHIDNGAMSWDVLPTRGMGLWQAHHGQTRLGWKSPVRGPVHPMFVDLGESSGLGWLDGFDELLVRCGLQSNGAPDFDDSGKLLHALHGRIGNRPAHHVALEVDEETGLVSLTGLVEETRFHFLKLRMTSTLRTMPHATSIAIVDRIENLSASPAEFQLLYHWNFGIPLLDSGSQVIAPATDVAPRDERAAEGLDQWSSFAADQAGFAEQVYLCKLAADQDGWTQVLLKNAHGSLGASLKFNIRQVPCFTLWKNTTALNDGYVTGLEPGTNFPNPRSFEGRQGRVIQLPPLGAYEIAQELHYHADASAVTQAERIVRGYRSQSPEIHATPPAGWIPG